MKARYFTQVPEHKLVNMTTRGLDYSIIKKLDTYLRDMAQLADRVRQIERLKAEKARVNIYKNERVAYVDVDINNHGSDVEYTHAKKNKADLAELKP